MPENLTVTLLQSPGELVGPAARLNWLQNTLKTTRPSDLIILPELFQCGYHIGKNIVTHAETADGDFAKAVQALARHHKTAIHYGYAERHGETLFNAAQCFDHQGSRLTHHRKLLIPPGFETTYFERGDRCVLFELKGFKLATLICYDVEFPENLRHVASLGADVVVVPTALSTQWGVVSEKLVPTRAFENGVYLCYANSCGHENGLDYYGGSCIIGPDGTDLAHADKKPEILTATLDKSAVAAAQKRLPYLIDRQKLPWC